MPAADPRREAATSPPLLHVRPDIGLAIILALVTFAAWRWGNEHVVVLQLYILPVVVAAYYGGRARGLAVAAAATAIVVGLQLFTAAGVVAGGDETTERWFNILIWCAAQLLIAFWVGYLSDTGRRAFADLRHAYDGVLELLAKFIDTADSYTEAHSVRVSAYAAELARLTGLDDGEIETVRVAGLLHDVGKLDVGVELLRKAGDLDEHEWDEMRRHPARGAWIVERLGGLMRDAVPLILYHHEHWDGSGYYGLRGGEIPLGARVIAVADAWDAMTTDRPYRRGLPARAAIDNLRQDAGGHFDPDLVATFAAGMSDPGSSLALIGGRNAPPALAPPLRPERVPAG